MLTKCLQWKNTKIFKRLRTTRKKFVEYNKNEYIIYIINELNYILHCTVYCL